MEINTYQGQLKTFSDFLVGDKAQFEILVDEKLHRAFSELFGDFSPIHCNEVFCSNTKFKKRIGYAFLLTGFLSRLYGEYLPGGNSICIKQEAMFIKPFFIGDRLTIVGEIINKIESTQFLEIQSQIFRNKDGCIYKGTGIVQMILDEKRLQPLFQAGDRNICYADFLCALQRAGIGAGDILFVHSDIAVFGKLCVTDREVLLKSFIDVLKESVGEEGTIIMPSFSYSFCKGEVFDIRNSKSTVGTLSEYFRKLTDVRRSMHPIFSVSIWGKRKEELLSVSKDSFDQDSVFGRLHRLNGKIIFLGAPMHSCTFIHYIEQMHGVPYRYFKQFSGIIRLEEKELEDEVTFFVRNLEKESALDTDKLERYLFENRLMQEEKIGAGRILAVGAVVLFDEGFKMLDRDINFFLKG